MFKRAGYSWIPLGSFVLAVGLALIGGPTVKAVGKQAEGECIKWTFNKVSADPVGGGQGLKIDANVTGTSQGDFKNPKANKPAKLRILIPAETITTPKGGGAPTKADITLTFSMDMSVLGETNTETTTKFDALAILKLGDVKDFVKEQTGGPPKENPDGSKTVTVASGQGKWIASIEVSATAKKNDSAMTPCTESGTFVSKLNDLKPK